MCARCADRPERPCGRCGRTRRIARRAHDGIPDICDGCFRLPEAVCSRCQQRRPCSFAAGPEPVCTRCAARATAVCAHCGAERPPSARWPEGPVCDPCYNAALRRRGVCSTCRAERRLVAPPGPDATTCADCAGTPTTAHTCTGCGLEDKLYEKRHVRTLRAAPPHQGPAPRQQRRDSARAGTGLSGDHHHRRPAHRVELAPEQRRRRAVGRDGRRQQSISAMRRWTPTHVPPPRATCVPSWSPTTCSPPGTNNSPPPSVS